MRSIAERALSIARALPRPVGEILGEILGEIAPAAPAARPSPPPLTHGPSPTSDQLFGLSFLVASAASFSR